MEDGVKISVKTYSPNSGYEKSVIVPYCWANSKQEAKDEAKRAAENGKFVIRYDQRGYGSSAGEKEQNMEYGIKDLISILKFLEKKKEVPRPTLEMFA